MPPFQPIRGNTETNWGLVARVFPRLRWFVFYHEFSLVPCDIFVCFDWPLRLPILWFLVSNYKLTLGPAGSELTLMLCNLLVQWLPSDKCELTLGPAESELTLMLCNLLVQWLPSDKCDG